MKHKGLLTLIGSICLILVLSVLPFMTACPTPPEEEGEGAPEEEEEEAPAEVIHWRCNFLIPGTRLVCANEITQFFEDVKKQTNGRLVIEPHWNMELGINPAETFSVLKSGAIEMSGLPFVVCSKEIPWFGIEGIPYMVESSEEVWKAYEAMEPFRKETLEEWDVILLAQYKMYGTCEPYLLASKKSLTTIDDLQGLNVRTWSPQLTQFLNTLGCSSVVLPMSEVYTSLKTGVMDACLAENQQWPEYHWDEVTGCFTPFFYGLNNHGIGISKKHFDALPPDIQQVLIRCGETLKERVDAKKSDTSMDVIWANIIEEEDYPIYEFDEQSKTMFRTVSVEVFDKWIEDMGKADGWRAYKIIMEALGRPIPKHLSDKYEPLYGEK